MLFQVFCKYNGVERMILKYLSQCQSVELFHVNIGVPSLTKAMAY